MDSPWLEIIQSPDISDIPTPGDSNYPWQAMFACHVGIMEHQSWIALRWGFNAGVLFEESLDRQRLFLESQHSYDVELGLELPSIRALAFRYINTDKGLLTVLVAKVTAKTKEQVEVSANNYFRELKSTFPYDYVLSPATTRDKFLTLVGSELLLDNNGQIDIVQIKRCETPIPANRNLPLMQGLWHSGGRSHEQIWRSLLSSQQGILLNIILRPTVLYDNDIALYANLSAEFEKHQSDIDNGKVFNLYKEWHENFINRRLTPWKKYFYLQFHIVSPGMISENLTRSIGTVLTQNFQMQNPKSQFFQGYQVVRPPMKRRGEWVEKIYNMHLISWESKLPDPRLSEIADLEEVFAAIRIPYSPPGGDTLGFKYLPAENE